MGTGTRTLALAAALAALLSVGCADVVGPSEAQAQPTAPGNPVLLQILDSNNVARYVKDGTTSIPTAAAAAAALTSIETAQVNCGNPATQFGTNTSKTVTVTALAANADPVYLGDSAGVTASTGYEMVASASTAQPISNTNLFFCFSTAGTMDVSFLAAN